MPVTAIREILGPPGSRGPESDHPRVLRLPAVLRKHYVRWGVISDRASGGYRRRPGGMQTKASTCGRSGSPEGVAESLVRFLARGGGGAVARLAVFANALALGKHGGKVIPGKNAIPDSACVGGRRRCRFRIAKERIAREIQIFSRGCK